MIDLNEFETLAGEYNVIPLVTTILADMHTPVSTYLTFREEGVASFLFESVEPNEKVGRYSFVGFRPTITLRAKATGVEIRNGVSVETRQGNIFEALQQISPRYRQAPLSEEGGFVGGFVGFLGYDTVRHLESILLTPPGVQDTDDAVFGLFSSIVRFDHRRQLVTIIHNVLIDTSRSLQTQYEEGKKAIETIELRLRKTTVAVSSFVCDPVPIEDGMGASAYCDAVSRAKKYIVEGDIFQVVLSRRTRFRYSGDLFQVYRALRIINPSPYLFYVDFGDTKLVGSSPEVLVRVQEGVVEVLPIAGTRARGLTEAEDQWLEEELLRDQKELAEHVMLVDLGRNDVGRVSEFGSVEVPVFARVERYSHVMHIVSEVRGKMKSAATSLDALQACFPAGTVSGAPKVRAMEIISELEGNRRGVYAGAVGYIGFDGAVDTCIAIRTIVAQHDTLTVQTGAGIVADSVPENEYRETVNKSRAMLEALTLAAGGLSQPPESVGDRRRDG